MANRRFAAFALFLNFLLNGCSGGEGPLAPQAPRPGHETRPQFYFVFESEKANTLWQPAKPDAMSENFGARIETKRVSSEAETQSVLEEWNARPVDILTLGPGLPQKVYQNLKLPKNSHRIVIFVGEPPAPSSDPKLQVFSLDQTELERLKKSLSPHVVTFEESDTRADIWASLDWVEMLKLAQSAPAPKHALSVSSGLLQVKVRNGAPQPQKIQKDLEAALLKLLSSQRPH